MYELIQDKKIESLQRNQLNEWIEMEVVNLANDFGQNMAADLVKHTCERLRGMLIAKYKSWAVGEVHAAFQMGVSGAYGTVHKITVQRLFSWLNSAQQQRAVRFAFKNETHIHISNDLPKVTGKDYGSFICWLTRNKIYIDDLVPGIKIEKHTRNERLLALSKEFAEAKEMDLLPALKRRLYSEVGK